MSRSHLCRIGFALLFMMFLLGFGLIPARASSSTSGAGDYVAHHFTTNSEYPIWYTAGCTGHDEPELDPVSSLPGSAQDLTWTAVLPKDGTVPVSSVGPTFWWGGTVTDPNTRALFGQAFLEVQFYPDGVVTKCTPEGGFNLTSVPNAFSVCSPVWQVDSKTFAETAAFNAMLVDASTGSAMVMHGGDTITIHFYLTTPTDGWHITVQDVTSGHQGTIILDSQYGPLLPAFSTQQIGNSLGWGIVHDTPNAFVWEIGHTSPFTHPASQFCTPGQTICDSYDAAHWAGFTPLQIKGVTFADGSNANEWATVSDFGGSAEVNQDCSSYGGPFCIYPWFSSTGTAFNYGVDYPDTRFDYGQAAQFAPTEQCSGPLGPTYCDTVIHPSI
ncbi:MAG TPA: hypothetical protein VFV38_43505 [Ktedonobacteraceae bacterium]|nr:hypothetical protein [Ktedonobacteraceae bacterium]